ncbi:MAG: hypothetical protein II819_04630 [Fibrobacter sp.]|nr:hypothetical protein [Fibrobacter sp.]
MIATTVTEPQLVVNVSDASLMKSLKNAILLLKGVSSVRECLPKTEMSKKEFFAKLDKSIASMENGACEEMGSTESGADFLERIICRTK